MKDEIRAKMINARLKWIDISGVVCDREDTSKIKRESLKKMMGSPVLMYSAHCGSTKKKNEQMIGSTEK